MALISHNALWYATRAVLYE